MIQVGDEIKWNAPIGSYITYKVLVIDPNRPPNTSHPTFSFDEQVLLQWNDDGRLRTIWAYNYQALNHLYLIGKVKIVKRFGLPYTELKKFSFV